MIEQIRPRFFRVQIPLPESPLKVLNAYVVKGKDRNLIIDTGLNREECLRAMNTALARLEIDPARTDFFLTHLHADHVGLVAHLVAEGRATYLNAPDAEVVRTWTGWEPMVEYAALNGFPEQELWEAIHNHPGYRFDPDWIPEITPVYDGDTVEVAPYRFRVIETPGHTRGHSCLYESSTRILVSGDHILGDITPNIQCWSDEENPLKDYLASLDKVSTLPVDQVLPGHRSLLGNPSKRIATLKEHHGNRLEEVLAIVEHGATTAFEIASHMTWDIACESWEDFPVVQKWFAIGEAIAHLRYLEEEGRIQQSHEGGRIVYRPCRT